MSGLGELSNLSQELFIKIYIAIELYRTSRNLWSRVLFFWRAGKRRNVWSNVRVVTKSYISEYNTKMLYLWFVIKWSLNKSPEWYCVCVILLWVRWFHSGGDCNVHFFCWKMASEKGWFTMLLNATSWGHVQPRYNTIFFWRKLNRSTVPATDVELWVLKIVCNELHEYCYLQKWQAFFKVGSSVFLRSVLSGASLVTTTTWVTLSRVIPNSMSFRFCFITGGRSHRRSDGN